MMKEDEFILLLEQTMADDEVKKIPECLQMLSDSKTRLNQGEPASFVAARLSKSISWYLVTHHYKAPKAIIDFSKSFLDAPVKHRGQISIAFWLSNLFHW